MGCGGGRGEGASRRKRRRRISRVGEQRFMMEEQEKTEWKQRGRTEGRERDKIIRGYEGF